MASSTDRLERLIADEIGDCCAADVDERLCELDALAERAGTGRVAADTGALSVLGNDTRYTIARLLAAAEGDLCVCELAPLVDVSESAVSHALSDLTDAGLAVRRKEGKWRYYAATRRAEAVLDALDATRGVEPAAAEGRAAGE